MKLSEQARWEEAETAFAESAEVSPNANCLLNLAVARFQVRRPLGGLAALDQLDHLGDIGADQRERARGIRARLEGQVAAFSITVTPATAELAVDGHVVAGHAAQRVVRLDPGAHTIALTAPGYVPLTRPIDAEAGATTSLPLTMVAMTVVPLTGMRPGENASAGISLASTQPAQPGQEEKRSVLKSPWLWGGVGAVAVGTVIAALLISSHSGAGVSPSGGSERIILSP